MEPTHVASKGKRLRNPNEAGVIGAATVCARDPIFGGRKMRDVPVKKQELRTPLVNVESDIVLLGHRRALAVVEEPDGVDGLRDGRQSHRLIAVPSIVHMLVEAVKEKVQPVALVGAGRTDPN